MKGNAPVRAFRRARTLAGVGLASFGVAFAFAAPPPKGSAPIPAPTYERDVLPILRTRCLGCHDGSQAQAGLDLSTRASVLKGAASGPVVNPAAPEKSRLVAVLASGAMPPGPQKLSADERRRVLAWIRAGAAGDAAGALPWAFRPPTLPSVPKIPGAANPIDAFVRAKLAEKGLDLSPEADRRTLIRRATVDVTGLPPTPEEIDAFLQDTRPGAWERVVERLLASPHYGERWGRHWLDLAGYADSEGVLQEDRVRPNAWRYRDWVVKSLNADKPYDRFLLEQIAGDELSGYRDAKAWTPEIEEMVTATGFLRTAVDATRDDFNEHQFTEYQTRMLQDTQTILVSSTLALTLQCARCHDHKFEPISQKDYYRVQAALEGAIRPRGKLLPTYRRQIVAATADAQKRAAAVNAEVDAAVAGIAQREAALLADYRGRGAAPKEADPAALRKAYPDLGPQLDALAAERDAQNRRRVTLTEIRALYDQDAAPPPTRLLHRGEMDKPRDTVAPGVPEILADPRRPFVLPTPAPGAATTGRRTALARWIVHPQNPLTARALVNRVWAHHFGVGITPTPENLGRSGAPPSHPELLDWLAVTFVRDGWSLKALHRRVLLSQTYRQASALRPAPARVDPENRLLWRQRSRRLDAESIRDGVLATAGTLDRTLYGAPVGLDVSAAGEVTVAGEASGGRRSLYVQVRRTQPVTVLNAFDAPVMETNCTRRVVSATPTQALTLLNSSFLATQSARFAARLTADVPSDRSPYALLGRRVERAFRLAYGRAPTAAERRAAVGFVQSQQTRYARRPATAGDADARALADFCLALLSANEFLYVD